PWTSDGTQAGTVLLHDVAHGPASSWRFFEQVFQQIHSPVPLDDRVLVRLYRPGWEADLWRCGIDGAVKVAENHQTSSIFLGQLGYSPVVRPLASVGEDLVFQASDGVSGYEPWRSDGTPAG